MAQFVGRSVLGTASACTRWNCFQSSYFRRLFTSTDVVSSVSGGVTAPLFTQTSTPSIPEQAKCRTSPTIITKLSNGMRVASQHMPLSDTLTIGVWIDSGSRYDDIESNGAAHFLEHMTFKGTKRRTRIQLEQEIENMGAHLNAYTSREQTVYYAKAFNKDVGQCLDILSDILLNSEIHRDALEMEKHVILREMIEVEKQTEEVIFDRLHTTAFRDDPLGFTILGPKENIEGMTREHLLTYIKNNYYASRFVIAAAGDINHKNLVEMTEKYFQNIPVKATSRIALPKPPKPYFCGSELLYRDDENTGPHAHVAVGFQGVSWNSPDVVAFMLMQSIIGSYKRQEEGIVPGIISANNTIRNLCNKMNQSGAVEMYTAFNTCYKDTGLFGFYSQCDEVALEHCVMELMFGITSLSYSVTDEEVERAKNQLKTQLLGHLDSTTAIAEDIGRQILVYGRHIPVAEFLLRLDNIDAQEIKRVAWKYLHDSEVAVTALGPLHSMPQLIDIRRATYWLRY